MPPKGGARGPDHERTRAVRAGALERAADVAGTGAGPVIRAPEPAGAADEPVAAGSNIARGGSSGCALETASRGSASQSGTGSDSPGADSSCHPAGARHCSKQRTACRYRTTGPYCARDQHASPPRHPPVVAPPRPPLRVVFEEKDIIKGACQVCGGHLEYSVNTVGDTRPCPHCGKPTILSAAAKFMPAPPPIARFIAQAGIQPVRPRFRLKRFPRRKARSKCAWAPIGWCALVSSWC